MSTTFRNPMTGEVKQVPTQKAFMIDNITGDAYEVGATEADQRTHILSERARRAEEDPNARAIARLEIELRRLKNV